MVKSMTGFGRCELSDDNRKITVELKSVNHRYLDLNIKMPKKFNCFEADLRSLLKKYIQRGKVDVFISSEDFSEQTAAVKYNEAIAAEYLEYLLDMSKKFDIECDIRASQLARFPEVFTMQDQPVNEDELWNMLKTAIEGACTQFVEARTLEGERLREDIENKLDEMLEGVEAIELRAPEILKVHQEKLEDKIREVLGDTQMDESRIAAELVIFADKICTDEETVRLKSHIRSMKKTLKEDAQIGRKLDFIAQEMNREANTILSKANDIDTSSIAIELKTSIEKVREQIQNIE